jgi:poly-gamma-glutamate capsule biosynthesis protein CapA/YwtB (metallophosphatase superfamily)
MRPVSARLARIAAVAALAFVARALPAGPGRAAPASQRDDRLDQPLLAANMCGAGDTGDVHFTLAATGDTFPHENIQAAGEAQGYDALFDHVRPFLKAADLAYTNFDGAMLEGSPYTGYPAFNYNPKLAAALKNAGIGLVSTANNHIMDRGPEGLDATLKVLAQSGIVQHGTVASDAADQPRPAYLPISLTRDGAGLQIAFLSFSWGTNGIPDPYNQVNLLWQSNDYGTQGGVRQSVLDAIAQARREADIVVVAAHWGFEYQFYPDATQIEGAKQMAAAGADVILGAQAHTLQPVDILDTNGRKTLVIYSLANFLASQGAFQDPSYSATATIFYVGLVRHADGSAGVTGYRYLPTIHVDADTRPAPIPPAGYEGVIEHVRAEMRDFDGARQLGADPAALGPRVEICPTIALPDGGRLAGDFAQFYTTSSGTAPRSFADTQAVFGAPIDPVARELAGDCRTLTSVLTTERQRLELHPELDWPFRVSGTQLGVAVYRQKHGAGEIQRRTNLEGDAIADPRFKSFFQTYGGLAAFGYPISPALTEPDEKSGQPTTVQYFERARLELIPGAAASASLPEQVRLGALVREYPGMAALCPDSAALTGTAAPAPGLAPQATAGVASGASRLPLATTPLPAPPPSARPWWLWPLIGLNVLLLAGVGLWGLQMRAEMLRRQARAARARKREWATRPPERPAPYRRPAPPDDDELLRRLLGQ